MHNARSFPDSHHFNERPWPYRVEKQVTHKKTDLKNSTEICDQFQTS